MWFVIWMIGAVVGLGCGMLLSYLDEKHSKDK